uniref:Uncharacterized protein n=1 Tax=Tetradesmus obliquus TaxID=3088 RepID=A0A383WAQ7_TETOB|eukprot:jgi/Sobl393_1/13024/SZX74292.1
MAPVDQQAVLLRSPVLPLVLQHSSVHTDLQAVLQLCCTSKAIRAAVLQQVRGLLDVSFTTSSSQHTQCFAAWISKYGQLMGCLSILPGYHHQEPSMYGFYGETAENQLEEAQLCIAAALVQLQQKQQKQQQQRDQGSMQLRALQLLPAVDSADALLQAVPSSMLLSLHLKGLCSPSRSLKTAGMACIAAFSQLQSLVLAPVLSAEQLQHVLPALTALTHLELQSRSCFSTAARSC